MPLARSDLRAQRVHAAFRAYAEGRLDCTIGRGGRELGRAGQPLAQRFSPIRKARLRQAHVVNTIAQSTGASTYGWLLFSLPKILAPASAPARAFLALQSANDSFKHAQRLERVHLLAITRLALKLGKGEKP